MEELLSTLEYLKLYKSIIKNKKSDNNKKIKIALLSSFTIKGLKEVLTALCYKENIEADIYEGPYKQCNQEIMTAQSKLYEFMPDVIFILIDSKDLLGDFYFNPYSLPKNQRVHFIASKKNEIKILYNTMKKNTKAKIIFNNFEVPAYSPLGILENKQDFGFFETVRELNQFLLDTAKTDDELFIFDFDGLTAKIGKKNMVDRKIYFLADMKMDVQLFPLLAWEYLSYIKPLLCMSRKCLVLDLDNTLWGGVIGEEGIEGIKLGLEYEGKVFYEFQKNIQALYEKGVILAINSKNNYEDVKAVFENHPYMILKEEQFASIKINWNDKILNMMEIAKELNIGLDSLVFIDDDKINQELMKNSFPEVLTLDMPSDITKYSETLKAVNEFNNLYLTDEDTEKNKMYKAQHKRNDFKKNMDTESYLKELNTELVFEELNSKNARRIAQLTQKTNQFNMTVKRYFVVDLYLLKDKQYEIYSVHVKDKFGDNGICGVIIFNLYENPNIKELEIDVFLLSCRVLGRNIEKSMLDFVFSYAKKENVKTIISNITKTKKNKIFNNFYENNGFTIISEDETNKILRIYVS